VPRIKTNACNYTFTPHHLIFRLQLRDAILNADYWREFSCYGWAHRTKSGKETRTAGGGGCTIVYLDSVLLFKPFLVESKLLLGISVPSTLLIYGYQVRISGSTAGNLRCERTLGFKVIFLRVLT
jgi:hypothetical protein